MLCAQYQFWAPLCIHNVLPLRLLLLQQFDMFGDECHSHIFGSAKTYAVIENAHIIILFVWHCLLDKWLKRALPLQKFIIGVDPLQQNQAKNGESHLNTLGHAHTIDMRVRLQPNDKWRSKVWRMSISLFDCIVFNG